MSERHRSENGNEKESGRVLTVRSHSGASGDMLLAGLAWLNLALLEIAPASPEADAWLDEACGRVAQIPVGCVRLRRIARNGIAGWQAQVNLPDESEHRRLDDIREIIETSALDKRAATWALNAFKLLAEAEASVHGVPVSEIHFHEVGALDSVLDICLVCEFFARLNPSECVCGPLPLADGLIRCAHGVLPAPAPATLSLLSGIPARPFEGSPYAGELVTPTAASLLRALPVEFGRWPTMRVERSVLIYGQKEFPDAPNGLTFVMGEGE